MRQSLTAEIISTGSELMLGHLVDSNSAWISTFLGDLGIKTVRHTSVGDDLARLIAVFKQSWAENTVVVVTGGLGPTEDDLTRQAAADAFGCPLEYDESLAQELRELFHQRGYQMAENNLRQAWRPRSTLSVPNPVGTAPGFALAEEGKLMVFLPGVPHEMKIMAASWLEPRLKAQFPGNQCVRQTFIIKIAGLGESSVDSLMGDLIINGQNPTVGLLSAPDQIKVLVTASGQDQAEAETVAASTIKEIEKRLHGHVFGYGDDTLPKVVARLLKEKDLTLTVLDAVTQGRLSGRLAPCLDLNNWSGCQDLPWQPTLSGITEILRLYAPDSADRFADDDEAPSRRRHRREIRLIATAQPDWETQNQNPEHIAIILESAVQSESLNNGKPLTRKTRLGGERDRTLARASVLTLFHLWQVLMGFDQD